MNTRSWDVQVRKGREYEMEMETDFVLALCVQAGQAYRTPAVASNLSFEQLVLVCKLRGAKQAHTFGDTHHTLGKYKALDVSPWDLGSRLSFRLSVRMMMVENERGKTTNMCRRFQLI